MSGCNIMASSGLSFEDFSKLQDFINDTPKSLKEVVQTEFSENGQLHEYDPEKPIDFQGFSKFLSAYIGESFPDSVKVNLFLSFMRRGSSGGGGGGGGVNTASTTITSGGCGGTVSGTKSTITSTDTVTRQNKPTSISRSITAVGASGGNLLSGLTGKLALHLQGREKAHVHSHQVVSSNSGCGSSSAGVGPPYSLGSVSAQSQPSLVMHGIDDNVGLTQRSSSKKSLHSLHLGGLKVDQDVIWRQRDSPGTKVAPAVNKASPNVVDHRTFIRQSDTINMKDLLCYLSLLESGRPEDKLEFMFRLYDSDSNGVLDKSEMDCIINQMMNVANYLQWDTQELRPILLDMMDEIDYDNDGEVTLEEWKKGGMTNVPLLVLLGLDVNVRDDGKHAWRLKHFRSQSLCALCHKLLGGFGRQGLSCTFCKYTVHERCAKDAPASCISTYTKTKKSDQQMEHHWVEANIPLMRNNCARCRKATGGVGEKIGFHCRWCKSTVHQSCIPHWKPYCEFGELKEHILPPTAIFPAVLERKPTSRRLGDNSMTTERQIDEQLSFSSYGDSVEASVTSPSLPPSPKTSETQYSSSSFQISVPPGCHPLLVFINPKSGGKQGLRILRKFQFLLNPRQVYDLIADSGPQKGLQFFRDVREARILVCGGDGTVGWLLEAMDKMEWDERERPPVAVLPLGTGNDLARCLRWGGGYENESLIKYLLRVSQGTVVMLDRWKIVCSKPPMNQGVLRRTSSSRSQTALDRQSQQQNKKISLSSTSGATTLSIETFEANNSPLPYYDTSQDAAAISPSSWGGTSPLPLGTFNMPSPGLMLEDNLMGDEMPLNIINNYFSIGCDASIAHKFHMMREKHPERFNSRMRNRFFYMEFGTSEVLTASCKNLHEYVDIICDGVALDLRQGTPLEGIAVLNIPSVYGGSNLWGNTSSSSSTSANVMSPGGSGGGGNVTGAGAGGAGSGGGTSSTSVVGSSGGIINTNDTNASLAAAANSASFLQKKRKRELKKQIGPQKKNKKKLNQRNESPSRRENSSITSDNLLFAVQDMGDHMLEVVGLENAMHAGLVAGGLRSSGKRLSQCQEIVIRTQRRFPMQIDGEPWMQTPCTISITHKNQVTMVMAPPTKKTSFFSYLFSRK